MYLYSLGLKGLQSWSSMDDFGSSRSVNARMYRTTSDPYAKDQSEGHRPQACNRSGSKNQSSGNILDTMRGLRDLGRAGIDWVEEFGEAADEDWQTVINNLPTFKCEGLRCSLVLPDYDPSQMKSVQMAQEAGEFLWDNRDLIISLIPVVGDFYDLASGLLGEDLLTGRDLHGADKWLTLAGGIAGAFTFLDEVGVLTRMAGRTMDAADKAMDATKAARGLSKAGEMGDVARGLSHVDEMMDTAQDLNRLKNLDNIDEALTAAKNLDHTGELLSAGGKLDEVDEAVGTAVDLNRADELAYTPRLSDNLDDAPVNRPQRTDAPEGSNVGGVCDFGKNSFTAGTAVQTDEGEKPIEEVAVGDKVLAEDPATGEQGYFEVVALTNHPTDEVLQITIDAEDESGDNGDEQLNSTDTEDSQTDTMEITPDHPVYVEDKGWLNAENLEVGDELRRSDGGVTKVLAVERVALAEPQAVYNFTVKRPHTYFVLSSGVLVHNNSPLECGPFEGYEPIPGGDDFVYTKRTDKKVPLVHKNIPDTPTSMKNSLDDWEVDDGGGVKIEDGIKKIYSNVKGPGDSTGHFERWYDPSKNKLFLNQGFAEQLPTWVKHDYSMTAKGTPTGAFFTMYQMKRLEIPEGSLSYVEMDTIINFTTGAQLKWLQRKHPHIQSLDELIEYTHSISYAKTPLIQSGYEIVPGSFKVTGETKIPAKTLKMMSRKDPEELMNLLKIKDTDDLWWGFKIEFEVRPVR